MLVMECILQELFPCGWGGFGEGAGGEEARVKSVGVAGDLQACAGLVITPRVAFREGDLMWSCLGQLGVPQRHGVQRMSFVMCRE